MLTMRLPGTVATGLAMTLALGVPSSPAQGVPPDILIADCQRDAVVRYSIAGELIGDFVPAQSAGMVVPHNMVWGPDRDDDGWKDLYVVALGSNAVHLYSGRTGVPIGGGIFADQWIASGRDLDWGPDRNGDGRRDLYVLNFSSPRRIVWFDGVTGALGGEFLDAASAGGYDHAEFMTFGPDTTGDGVGEIYATGAAAPNVWKFDGATGAFLGHFVSGGGLVTGRDLVFRDDGWLYVCNAPPSTILRFDTANRGIGEVFVESGAGGLVRPHGLAFGPDGNGDGVEDLYVAGEISATVTSYDAITGAYLQTHASPDDGALVQVAALVFMDLCPADVNGNDRVGTGDLLALLGAWGVCEACPEDLDGDGTVGTQDLLTLLSVWGACPP